MSEPSFDLVLRDCVIFGTDVRTDIGVRDGIIAEVHPGLRAAREIACARAFVSSAWIDSHIHVGSPATPGRLDALAYGPAQGVGALIDAGSAPPARLGELLSLHPWVYALANVDSRGIRGEGPPEISGAAAAEALSRYPDRVRGVKVQASASVLGESSLSAIENAQRAAERHRVPVMVHVGNPPPRLDEVCDLLRPGDVITHYAHGKPQGATLPDGSPLPALRRACERGVLLDVGHGRSSFSFERFRRLFDDGIRPFTISTDLHASSAKTPVVSLARTMSKLVALGLTREAAVAAVTSAPAGLFGLDGYAAPIEAGAPDRLTVFRIDEGEFETEDSLGKRLVCKTWFRPLGCVLDGGWNPAETPI